MKFSIALLALVTLSVVHLTGAAQPSRWVMPRLPLTLLMSGKYRPYNVADRIVGGSEVTPNSLPFQLSLQRRAIIGGTYSQSCGASLLSESKVLCAAHCLTNIVILGNYRIVAGEHNLADTSGLEQNSNIARFTNHPDYNGNTYENDVALIFLSTSLTLGTAVAPIKLPELNQEYESGAPLTISGWGTTSSGGSISNVLLSAQVSVVDDATCGRLYENNTITPSMICAADPGVDSCQGDSGGPLFDGPGSNAVQVGIVSWGIGCADPKYPGVYTQVSYFVDWINNNN